MARTPAWQRKEGQNPRGGLNAKGRASYKRETGGTLRRPVKSGDNPRRGSFFRAWERAKVQTVTVKVGPQENCFHCVPGVHRHQLMRGKKVHQFLNVTEQKRRERDAWLWDE